MVVLIRPTVLVELDPTAQSAVKEAAVRVEGVEFLTGTYTVISRMFHSQRVFKKSKDEGSAAEAPLFLYYWRGGEGTPAGWWFGNAIGPGAQKPSKRDSFHQAMTSLASSVLLLLLASRAEGGNSTELQRLQGVIEHLKRKEHQAPITRSWERDKGTRYSVVRRELSC
eukprot:s1024_g9.t1